MTFSLLVVASLALAGEGPERPVSASVQGGARVMEALAHDPVVGAGLSWQPSWAGVELHGTWSPDRGVAGLDPILEPLVMSNHVPEELRGELTLTEVEWVVSGSLRLVPLRAHTSLLGRPEVPSEVYLLVGPAMAQRSRSRVGGEEGALEITRWDREVIPGLVVGAGLELGLVPGLQLRADLRSTSTLDDQWPLFPALHPEAETRVVQDVVFSVGLSASWGIWQKGSEAG